MVSVIHFESCTVVPSTTLVFKAITPDVDTSTPPTTRVHTQLAEVGTGLGANSPVNKIDIGVMTTDGYTTIPGPSAPTADDKHIRQTAKIPMHFFIIAPLGHTTESPQYLPRERKTD